MEFRKTTNGIIAGNFDVIHPGYIDMFNEMESLCDEVIILLQTDPSIERPTKLKPILSVNDRIKILSDDFSIDDLGIHDLNETKNKFTLLVM